jgi:hypothetical protein
MLVALAHTARDLGIGLLIACFMCGFALAAGRFIRGPVSPEFAASDLDEPKDAGDLDDWLAEVGPLEEFKLWERPKSEAELERRPV